MATKKTIKKEIAKKSEAPAKTPRPKPRLCQNCGFYFLKGLGNGLCFRFPTVVKKGTENWCGEHKFKNEMN